MDTQTNNIINQPLINPNPTPAPEIKAPLLTRITNWINMHRKLTLSILAGFFLVIVLILVFFPSIKNKLFNLKNTSQTPTTNTSDVAELGSIILTSSKNTFGMTEKIPVSVKGDTNNKAITAFDVVIEYDPEFLALTNRKTPLQDFNYYGNNNNQSISVAAIQKPNSQSSQILKNTNLLDLEFTPKKPGKTTLKIVYSPNSTSDSNLLDGANKDILTIVRGMEITIN